MEALKVCKHKIRNKLTKKIFVEIKVKNEDPYILQNVPQDEGNKKSKITVLEYEDADKTQILVGQASKCVQIWNLRSNLLKSIDIKHSPAVGVVKANETLIVGCEDGQIEKISEDNKSSTFKSGNNISRLRSNPYNKNVFATGGKDRQNNLKIFDITKDKEIFSSKNLPNDHLQL